MSKKNVRKQVSDAKDRRVNAEAGTRDDWLAEIRRKALSDEGISDSEMAAFQARQRGLNEERDAGFNRMDQVAAQIEAQDRAREAAMAERQAERQAAQDMVTTSALSPLSMFEGRNRIPDARPASSDETYMSETPPSEEWVRWNAAKQAADKGTGERSLVSALKQYYLSQTEPDKYGERTSEGDLVKMGLGAAAGIPLAPLMASVSPLVAGVQGAATVLPDYALGTSTAGDVASAAALEGGFAHGINKIAARFAPKSRVSPLREPELRQYSQLALPAPSPRALPAPAPRISSPLAVAAPQSQRLLKGNRAPTFLKAGEAPDGLYYYQGLHDQLADAAKALETIGNSPRKYKGRGGQPVNVDLSHAVPNAPDGLYYTKGLDDSLREAGMHADEINTPFDYTALMRSLAADMDSINNYRPTKVAPQFKMLDPWGKMTDGVPVQFRQGGTVQYK